MLGNCFQLNPPTYTQFEVKRSFDNPINQQIFEMKQMCEPTDLSLPIKKINDERIKTKIGRVNLKLPFEQKKKRGLIVPYAAATPTISILSTPCISRRIHRFKSGEFQAKLQAVKLSTSDRPRVPHYCSIECVTKALPK